MKQLNLQAHVCHPPVVLSQCAKTMEAIHRVPAYKITLVFPRTVDQNVQSIQIVPVIKLALEKNVKTHVPALAVAELNVL